MSQSEGENSVRVSKNQGENMMQAEQNVVNVAQKENFVITVDALNHILQTSQKNREKNNLAGFPFFDPDHSRVDIEIWCTDIDMRAKRDDMKNFDIIPRVQAALMGRAQKWFDKYGYQHYEWNDFRASLKHAFSSGSDIVSQLRNVVNTESNSFASYTEYVMEKTSQIDCPWKSLKIK